MTWWAVSLTLLNHEFGNEVLSRAQLLQVVPIFVAVLVWLTRILFIGALSVAGEQWAGAGSAEATPAPQRVAGRQTARLSPRPAAASQPSRRTQVHRPAMVTEQPRTQIHQPARMATPTPRPAPRPAPRPQAAGPQRPAPMRMQAQSVRNGRRS
jgi:hypothetical protein